MKTRTGIRVAKGKIEAVMLCVSFLFFVLAGQAQVTLAFQGGEAGDTWGYTSSGASAIAQAEITSPQNYVSGSASIVAGGNTGGGNCWAGGSGNGPSVARQFTFNSVDISSSNESVRTLTFNWGNRYPMCNGTGWDAGENLTFTAYHDGVSQGTVSLATGNNNAGFQIDNNTYTWNIPACVNNFYCVMSVTTNRSDELLFLDDVRLTAPQLNASSAQPSPVSGAVTLCAGAVETYNVYQVPGTLYTWSGLPAGAQFTTANGTAASHTITVDWGTAAAGTYTLTVTPSNACGATGTPQTLDVTISNAGTPVVISGPATICPGTTIVLSSNYGSGNLWSTSEGTQTISITAPGTYDVSVSTGCGIVTDSHIVTALPAPVAAITPNGTVAICTGDAVTLTASGGDTYQWTGGPATAAYSVNAAGTYTVTLTNSCGSDNASVTVTESPLPNAQISGTLSYCAGGSTTLTASGGTSYQWTGGPATDVYTISAPGTYTVTVTSSCGTDNETVTVTELPLPDAQIAGTLSYCEGSSTTLTASGGTSYQWAGGPATDVYTVSAPGTYTVTATNSCGTDNTSATVNELPLPDAQIAGTLSYCEGSSTTLTASGGTSYQWAGGPATDTYTISAPGTYTVTVTNSCGTDNASATVTELPLPDAQIAGTLSYCEGSSTTLTASGGTSYQWTGGPATDAYTISAPGTYTVTVTNSCGTDNASATVTELPLPNAQITGTLSFCEGGSTTLTASGGTSYQWSGGPATAAITVTAPGTYTVAAITSCGNDIASATVTQTALPVAQIAGATTFCSGSSTILTASGGTSYQWTGGPATAAFSVNASGTYTVTATNSCGSDAASVTVTESVVQAAFTASSLIGNAPVEIAFTNTSLPLTAAFDWDFADGGGSSAVHPVHTFVSEGSYTVTLTAVNADGCTDAASLLITVTGLPAMLEVPNVFTPNGDQANDVFVVAAERIAAYHILIFNRWGNTVAESDDVLMEWDGTMNGEPASEGTYFYRIAATGMDGKSYDKTGFFELVR